MKDCFAPKIVAVDFDGTLCTSAWPDIGEPNLELIDQMIRERKNGTTLILWTCREGSKLYDAVSWCAERGLEFDYVNRNADHIIDTFGIDSRKIFANEYIDDRNTKRFTFPPSEKIENVEIKNPEGIPININLNRLDGSDISTNICFNIEI